MMRQRSTVCALYAIVYIYDGTHIYDITSEMFEQQNPGPRLERLMAFQHYFVILRPSFVMA